MPRGPDRAGKLAAGAGTGPRDGGAERPSPKRPPGGAVLAPAVQAASSASEGLEGPRPSLRLPAALPQSRVGRVSSRRSFGRHVLPGRGAAAVPGAGGSSS